MLLCVGSYARSSLEDSIHFFNFNEQNGRFRRIGGSGRGKCISSIAFGEKYLYAANDLENIGHIDAFLWERDGRLEQVGECAFPGGILCQITVLPDKKHIAGANYLDGSVIIYALTENGIPDRLSFIDRHQGVGFDKTGRQDKPYVHFCCVAPDTRRLFVNDLGLDWSAVYLINYDKGTLQLDSEENQIYFPGGEGPRHMVFSSDGKFWYLITEMGCHVFSFFYDQNTGHSTPLQKISLLPEGFDGFNIASDIHLSPDGRFLYCANRGLDDIVCFRVNTVTGLLSPAAHYSIPCHMSRSFSVANNFIFIAGSANGIVVAMERDPATGALKNVTDIIRLSEPAFVTVV